MTEILGPLQVSLIVLVLAASVYDLRYRQIPNWLTAAGLMAGFGFQAIFRGWTGLRQAALGSALAFGIYLILFALRALGGGDLKLMTAIGAIVGPLNWLVIFVTSSIINLVLVILFVLRHGTLLKTVMNVLFLLGQLLRLRAPYRQNPELDVSHPIAVTLPHAIPIALGCLLFLLLTRLHS